MEKMREGVNPFTTEVAVEGEVRFLDPPKDVLQLIKSGEPKENILLVRGGTRTVLAPALRSGSTGLITMSGMSGAPAVSPGVDESAA